MTYAEKLKHPRWQKKRLEIFQRDGFRCQKCGSDDISLNVHHKKYIYGNSPWDYSNDLLITLCEPCHKKHHESGESHIAGIEDSPSTPLSQMLQRDLEQKMLDASLEPSVRAKYYPGSTKALARIRADIAARNAEVKNG